MPLICHLAESIFALLLILRSCFAHGTSTRTYLSKALHKQLWAITSSPALHHTAAFVLFVIREDWQSLFHTYKLIQSGEHKLRNVYFGQCKNFKCKAAKQTEISLTWEVTSSLLCVMAHQRTAVAVVLMSYIALIFATRPIGISHMDRVSLWSRYEQCIIHNTLHLSISIPPKIIPHQILFL